MIAAVHNRADREVRASMCKHVHGSFWPKRVGGEGSTVADFHRLISLQSIKFSSVDRPILKKCYPPRRGVEKLSAKKPGARANQGLVREPFGSYQFENAPAARAASITAAPW